jgi:polygalacturonase
MNITDCGAVADNRTLNTAAIQRAIDQVAQAGGGTVVVPPGNFLTGTIELRSRVTLQLEPGAVLRGSPNLADYRTVAWGQHIDRTPWHLLSAHNCHDVRICGGGTIDGNGPAFWEPTVGDDPLTCVPARQPDPAKAAGGLVPASAWGERDVRRPLQPARVQH